jgi:D-glycero-D-manno-heptose 1,7-bisphosphate phosphatase
MNIHNQEGEDLSPPTPTPVLYLDLDGTVRWGLEELGRFVNQVEDVHVFPEVPKILLVYKSLGWRVVGISNQGGIALGHMTHEQCQATVNETNRQCDNLFDLILFCPHAPRSSCLCRKPRTGMILQAESDLSQQYNESYPRDMAGFVGDREDDRGCAKAGGLPFMDAARWRDGGWRKWVQE